MYMYYRIKLAKAVTAVMLGVAAVAACSPAHAGTKEDLAYTKELYKAIQADQKTKKDAVALTNLQEKLAKACALLPEHPSCKSVK